MESEILTLNEAATVLKAEPDTLEALLAAGEIAGRHIGGEWRTTLRALVCYVEGVAIDAPCCPPGACCPPNGGTSSGCC